MRTVMRAPRLICDIHTDTQTQDEHSGPVMCSYLLVMRRHEHGDMLANVLPWSDATTIVLAEPRRAWQAPERGLWLSLVNTQQRRQFRRVSQPVCSALESGLELLGTAN